MGKIRSDWGAEIDENLCLGFGCREEGFFAKVSANEIVKEQMVQTTSKKIVRSSEKQKPRACVPHTPYVRTEGFVRATACWLISTYFLVL